jgi:hypothetical protein
MRRFLAFNDDSNARNWQILALSPPPARMGNYGASNSLKLALSVKSRTRCGIRSQWLPKIAATKCLAAFIKTVCRIESLPGKARAERIGIRRKQQ